VGIVDDGAGQKHEDKGPSVPRLSPSPRSGRELERRGRALLERVDEGRNVVLITFPLAKISGAVGGRKGILTHSESTTRTWSTILLLMLTLVVPCSTIDQPTLKHVLVGSPSPVWPKA